MSEMSVEGLIRKHFYELDRRLFLEENKTFANMDQPLPIGYGQTISQPSLVLAMTLFLKPFLGCKVLEIGTGSGYQTALLSAFAGMIYTVERLEPLYVKAKKRLEELGYDNVKMSLGDGWKGWSEFAPYDRIIVTAAASEVPSALLDQLAINGVMIIPIGEEGCTQELMIYEKDDSGKVTHAILEYVRFVPLVKD